MPASNFMACVLLVDDEPYVTDALSRNLSGHGCHVLKASSAADALRMLEQRAVDVVVSDEQMPGVPGSEFLSTVRRRFPDTIRMILSGQATVAAAVRAINEGEVHRFFLKPCNPTDMIFAIRQAVTHKRLEARSRELLREFRRQSARLEAVERKHGQLLDVQLDESGAILLEDDEAGRDVDDLLRDIEQAMARRAAVPKSRAAS
jgi:DNA-binding NtrC family response regulator